MLQYLVQRAIRLVSTAKNPAVGDVQPASAVDLSHKLIGKRCIVVGGTRGIGRGIALTLSRAGASVAAVGRNASAIVGEMESAAPNTCSTDADDDESRRQTLSAFSADLFTIPGAKQLVTDLSEARVQPFDYVFFTVGCWPDYTDPFTADGIEKTVALDLFARHLVLVSMIECNLLKSGARIMNTLASTQAFPFQSSGGVRMRLEESTQLVPPGRVPFSLMPVGVAADAWLRENSKRFADYKFVGMFPGLVATDVASVSFPKWIVPLIRAQHWLVSMSEEESGLIHVTVMCSDNVSRHRVSFYNHLLEARHAHHVAMDNELSEWVYDWLDKTIDSCREEA